MMCPHCTIHFHETREQRELGMDTEGHWVTITDKCPQCQKFTFKLARGHGLVRSGKGVSLRTIEAEFIVHPRKTSRPPTPAEVPESFSQDYNEACLVLSDSPKASASLSRRCLELLLTEKAGTKEGNLAQAIQEVLDLQLFPKRIAEYLDAVREIGNFGAHPRKSLHTGEIMSVAPGEAELNLEVLEALFDFFFVQPDARQKRLHAINARLAEAGKKPLKQPSDSE